MTLRFLSDELKLMSRHWNFDVATLSFDVVTLPER